MKGAAPALCLMIAATAAAAEPPAGNDATSGRRRVASTYRVREVRFTGDSAFEPGVLNDVLEQLRVRRVVPGIWTRRPRYSERAVQADLTRLRSFHISNGYLDSRIGLSEVTFDGRDARVTLDVRSGPRSAVRGVAVEGTADSRTQSAAASGGPLPVDALCRRLLDARQFAETHGRSDFAVHLEISDADAPVPSDRGRHWVDAAVRVRMGSSYTVGRISFAGHHAINESTLRRAMLLQERALFDAAKLRRSLDRLNRWGLLEPLTLDDVRIETNPDGLTADLTVSIRERPRGRWSLSGALVPGRFGRSLEGAISWRLPAWGRGVLEASTYYVTFNLIGIPNPLVRILRIARKPAPSRLLALERPYVPGQPLLSGFILSPNRSATTMFGSYGLTHLRRAADAALSGDTSGSPPLLVPVARVRASASGPADAGFLICEPREWQPRWGLAPFGRFNAAVPRRVEVDAR